MAQAVIEQADGMIQVGPFRLKMPGGPEADPFLDLLSEAAEQIGQVPQVGDPQYDEAIATLADIWGEPDETIEPLFRAWVLANRWDWQQSYWLAVASPLGPAILAAQPGSLESEGE